MLFSNKKDSALCFVPCGHFFGELDYENGRVRRLNFLCGGLRRCLLRLLVLLIFTVEVSCHFGEELG